MSALLPVLSAGNGVSGVNSLWMDMAPESRDPGVMVEEGQQKKTKKRVVTEARKEQNRQAQRAFRIRQKELRQRKDEEAKRKSGSEKPRDLRPRPEKVMDSSQLSPNSDGLSPASLPSMESYSFLPGTITPTEGDMNQHQMFGPSPPESPPLSHDTSISRPPPLTLVDPYANGRQLFPTTFFSAMLHNALALGFDLDMLAGCGAHCVSPFYRPSTPQDDPAALLSSILRSFSVEPPKHLRPTLTQVLIPHHIGLDLIPLPILRDRAIMLSAVMPFTFNIWEFKVDIYEGHGISLRIGHGGGWNGCQPWDRKNWNFAPWFLRKWSMCVQEEKEHLDRERLSEVSEQDAII